MQNIVRCLACDNLEIVSTSAPTYRCEQCGNVNPTAFPTEAITRRFSPGAKLAGTNSKHLAQTIVADLLEHLATLQIEEEILWSLAETIAVEIEKASSETAETVEMLFLILPASIRWSIGNRLGEQEWN